MVGRAPANQGGALAPILEFVPDNAGLTAYREGLPPKRSMKLTQTFRTWLNQNEPTELAKICVLSGAHIVISLRTQDFHFWGEPPQVRSAMALCQEWIHRVNQKGQRQFAKTQAYRWKQRVHQEQKNYMEENLQLYRRVPDEDVKFAPVVHWVPWGLAADPQVAFGPNLEALDDLRMQFKCWITIQKNHQGKGWTFRILGQNVQSAACVAKILRRDLPLNVAAMAMHGHQFYLVKPLSPKHLRQHIRWVDLVFMQLPGNESESAALSSVPFAVLDQTPMDTAAWKRHKHSTPFVTGLDQIPPPNETMGLDGAGAILISNSTSRAINPLYLECFLSECLKVMPWFLGSLSMRATIGVVAWPKYPDPPQKPLSEFKDLLHNLNRQDVQLPSHMLPLPPQLGQDLLSRFLDSRLVTMTTPWRRHPKNSDSAEQGLHIEYANGKDESPVLEGPSRINLIFDYYHAPHSVNTHQSQIQRPRTPGANQRLIKTFKASEIEQKGESVWELAPCPAPIVDMHILDLKTPGLSWNLNVSRGVHMSSKRVLGLPDYLRAFDDGIKVPGSAFERPHTDGLGSQTFIWPKIAPGDPRVQYPELQSVVQERIWRFTMNSSPGYYVELVLTEKFDVELKYEGTGNTAVCVGAELKPSTAGWRVPSRKEPEADANFTGSPRSAPDLEVHADTNTNQTREYTQDGNWVVRVRNQVWDHKMGQNHALKAGDRAEWFGEEWDLFPVPELTPSIDNTLSESSRLTMMSENGSSLDSGEDGIPSPGTMQNMWRGRVFERGSGIKEWIRVMEEVEGIIHENLIEEESDWESGTPRPLVEDLLA